MAQTKEPKNSQRVEKIDDARHHTFVMRIWETEQGVIKGYFIDPLTNVTYPLTPKTDKVSVQTTQEDEFTSSSTQENKSAGYIETLSCHIEIWREKRT